MSEPPENESVQGSSGDFKQLPPIANELTSDIGIGPSPEAEAETRQLASGKDPSQLKSEADEAEHRRTELFRNHFEWIAIAALYCLSFGFFIIFAVWVYHLIAFPDWPRLEPVAVERLQTILTAGLVVGVLNNHLSKRLSIGG